MDDTNPAKEDGDFADSYLADLNWLGFEPKNIIFSSVAYFEKMYEIAENLIREGKAYVCELSADEVHETRGTLSTPGTESPYRNRLPEENLSLFRDMRAGKFKDGEVTLRAKIDMASPSMCLRDPVIYRVLHMEHYKTGTEWCIYPMYDFAHPIEDALEGITYSLCDISFENNRPLYNWVIENCFADMKYPPRQIEFAPFKLENVLTGKRYLKQVVNSGKVLGWDDPRLFTLVGLKRRGIPAEGIKNFIAGNGVTKAVTILPLSNFEYYMRDELNRTTTRVMAVLDPLKVIITNYQGENEEITLENNPNTEEKSYHTSQFGREIYIEREDFSLAPPPKYNRLVEGGMVRLKNAYIIKCNRAVLNDAGVVDYLECEYLPETKSGSDESGIKVKGTIHFVTKGNYTEATIREFKNLTKLDILEPNKAFAAGIPLDEILEPNSMTESTAFVENYLLNATVGETFQFMRKGYYCLDPDSTPTRPVFNKTISLKDTFNK